MSSRKPHAAMVMFSSLRVLGNFGRNLTAVATTIELESSIRASRKFKAWRGKLQWQGWAFPAVVGSWHCAVLRGGLETNAACPNHRD